MLRISTLIAALTLAALIMGVSTAQAVVCSYDTCISNCFTAGGKHCLRGCDRRIARRQTSGICPWNGGASLDRRAVIGMQ